MPSALLDIHTHHLPPRPDTALYSCCMKDRDTPGFARAAWISVGIHPWYLSAGDLPGQLEWLESVLSSDRRVLAVGESGMDKLCGTPFDVQLRAFDASAVLAEKYGFPLIIHAVRSFNELVARKKSLRPSVPWIIHGFRGKKELARELLRQGFYLSFGEKFNREAAGAVPAERLLVETDESFSDVSSIRDRMADLRGQAREEFRTRLCLNAEQLFFGR